MSRKQKKMLTRILASAVLFALSFLLPLSGVFRLFYFITVYAVVGCSLESSAQHRTWTGL